MGYGGSEEKMLRDRAGMGHVHEALKALKALSARTGGCGQGKRGVVGVSARKEKGVIHVILRERMSG